MKVKFKAGGSILIVTGFLVLVALEILILVAISRQEEITGVMVWIAALFLLFVLMLYREIRFKLNCVEITDMELVVTPFFGLGPARHVPFTAITGFYWSIEPSKMSSGFVLYIYENKKRTIEILDAYCSNFDKFHSLLARKIKQIGNEEFSYINSFKSVFWVSIELPTPTLVYKITDDMESEALPTNEKE